MRISLLTLFPEMVTHPLEYSIVARAVKKNVVDIHAVNIRDFAKDHYKTVDDHPYGGGVGMILRVDIVVAALEHTIDTSGISRDRTRILLTDPSGQTYNQEKAQSLTTYEHLIIIAGHYEGIDARIYSFIDEAISIGDYVLSGGEIPAITIVDSVVRLLPGSLKHQEATSNESFSPSLRILEYTQYTRPEVFRNLKVPRVLVGGDHKKIDIWRKNQAVKKTKNIRPDLLSRGK